jgi:hypothetical protein
MGPGAHRVRSVACSNSERYMERRNPQPSHSPNESRARPHHSDVALKCSEPVKKVAERTWEVVRNKGLADLKRTRETQFLTWESRF